MWLFTPYLLAEKVKMSANDVIMASLRYVFSMYFVTSTILCRVVISLDASFLKWLIKNNGSWRESRKIWAKFEHFLNYRALKIVEFSNFVRGIPTLLCIRPKFRRTSRLNFVKKFGGSNLKTGATPGRTKISRWRKLVPNYTTVYFSRIIVV